jgi:hypothetical protein
MRIEVTGHCEECGELAPELAILGEHPEKGFCKYCLKAALDEMEDD